MRQLLLCRTFPPMLGGIERYISELFSRTRVDVHAIAPRVTSWQAVDQRLPYSVTRYPYHARLRRGKVPLLALGAHAIAAALKHKPRIVFSDQVQTAAVGLPLARLLSAAHIVFAYGFELSPRRLYRAKRLAFRASDTIVAISRFTRDALVNTYSVPPDRIEVVRPGIDTDRFSPHPTIRDERERLGLGEDDIVLLTVGRLEPTHRYKGYDRVIRLLATLLPQFSRARLLVVGEGADQRHLEGVARGLGISTSVRFTGRVADDLLPTLYRSADLFVLPSGTPADDPFLAEGYGIVFAEAAASGTPSVGYRVGGAVDAVEQGVTGLLTEPNEIALQAAVRALLENPERLRRMRVTAREFAVQHFGWNGGVAALNKLCDRLVQTGS